VTPEASTTDSDAKYANTDQASQPRDDSFDPIERALALGLEEATRALARGAPGALETIRALTEELGARRKSRAGVIALDVSRRRREG